LVAISATAPRSEREGAREGGREKEGGRGKREREREIEEANGVEREGGKGRESKRTGGGPDDHLQEMF